MNILHQAVYLQFRHHPHLRFFLEKLRDFAIFRFCDFFMYIVLVKKTNFNRFMKWPNLKKNRKIARFFSEKKTQMWMMPKKVIWIVL